MNPIPAARRRLRLTVPLTMLLMACTAPPVPSAPATTHTTAPALSTTASSSSRTLPPAGPVSAEDEVLAAYRRSWEVLAEAFRALDTTRLETVFAGAALQVTRDQLTEARATGQAVQVDVTHDPRVVFLDGDRAVVQDTYTNRSAPIDPATGQPVQVRPEVVDQRRVLTRINGVWKVTDIIEVEEGRSP